MKYLKEKAKEFISTKVQEYLDNNLHGMVRKEVDGHVVHVERELEEIAIEELRRLTKENGIVSVMRVEHGDLIILPEYLSEEDFNLIAREISGTSALGVIAANGRDIGIIRFNETN